MKTQEVFSERIQNFRDAVQFTKPKHIPIISNFWAYKILDAGYTLSEAYLDYTKLSQSVYNFQEKYNFDAYFDTNWRNPIQVSNALGFSNYIIDDAAGSVNYIDNVNMELEDYDTFIDNPEKFLIETFLPRKFQGLTPQKLKDGLHTFGTYLNFKTTTEKTLIEKYNVPLLSKEVLFAPIEHLAGATRGLVNLSRDMRRYPEKVLKASETYRTYYTAFDNLIATSSKGPDRESAFDIHVPLICHTLMGKKNFEKFYWSFLEELMDYAVKYDKIINIFAEGENSRLYDFFKQFPQGHVALYLEQDNLFKAKEILGDRVCLVGGFPTSLLSTGSPDDCINYAKKLIDELNTDGGYIFALDKMISYKRDCKPENLIAINTFVRNYTI